MKEENKKKLRNIVNAGIIVLGLGLGAYKAQQVHCNNNTTIKLETHEEESYYNAGCRLKGGSYSVLKIYPDKFLLQEWTWIGLKRHEYLDFNGYYFNNSGEQYFLDGKIDIAGETINRVVRVGFESYSRIQKYKQKAVSFERGDMLLAEMTDKYGGVESLNSIIEQIEEK